jgi:hypothetical protein
LFQLSSVSRFQLFFAKWIVNMVAGKLEDSSQEIADREEQKHCSAGFGDRAALRAPD